MMELIEKGGIVMWPIAGCALVALAIIVERALFFYVTHTSYDAFKEILMRNLACEAWSPALLQNPYGVMEKGSRPSLIAQLKALRWSRSPYPKIVRVYLENLVNGTRSREEALRRTGSEEIEKMERYFQGLSAISHVSPLLGLLGTVTGIIAAFGVISRLGGQVDVTALAGGIWEAMLTTAAGLIVAIPAQLSYIYYEKIVAERASRMSYIITYLNERLYRDSGGREREEGCGQYLSDSEIIPSVETPEEIVRDEVK